jgi:predicted ATPase
MIQSITFTEKWRCFEEGDNVTFVPGVNLLVGDQGCGKSSMLKAIQAGGASAKNAQGPEVQLCCTPCRSKFFDFEKDNPRTKAYFGSDIRAQVGAMFSSHGETNRAIIKGLDGLEPGDLVMMDEPDTALSLRSCRMLVQKFVTLADQGVQIIAAVHNPWLISQFDQVFSLEYRRWLTGNEQNVEHLRCDTCGSFPCGCGG